MHEISSRRDAEKRKKYVCSKHFRRRAGRREAAAEVRTACAGGTTAVFLQNPEKMRRGLDKGVSPDVYLQHDSQQGAARRKIIDSGKALLPSRFQNGINSFQHFIDGLSTLCRQSCRHRAAAAGGGHPRNPYHPAARKFGRPIGLVTVKNQGSPIICAVRQPESSAVQSALYQLKKQGFQ